MEGMSLSRNYSLIALNDQEVTSLTSSKKTALRGIAAAVIVEWYLDGSSIKKKDQLLYDKKEAERSLSFMQHTVLACLAGKKKRMKKSLTEWLELVTKLSRKQLKEIETAVVTALEQDQLLKTVPSLLSCDLEFETAGISVQAYQSEEAQYKQVVERFRTDILESGSAADESVVLFWLLQENGLLQDIFKEEEWDRLAECYQELPGQNGLAKTLFPITIHRKLELFVKKILKRKKGVMAKPGGAGVNFVFPFLERSESVFIDTESYFPDQEERFHYVLDRLTAHEIPYEVIRGGDVPILKINNALYHAIPHAKKYRVPVHGVQLRRHPLSP